MEKYEITKEQILELENGFTLPKLKEWFPDAFKTELEVGKWYKDNRVGNFMFYFQGVYSNMNDSKAYGFTLSGKWYENLGVDKESTYFEATGQEVKTALENEAKKKYKIGNYVFDKWSEIKAPIERLDEFDYSYNSLFVLNNNNSKTCLFYNGNWATIIPTLTKKEAEEKLCVKII